MNYTIKKYHTGCKADWDDLIKRSSNGTFLHQRDYMDYHADRFEDFSLMIYEGLKLRAVLPAHRIGNEIFAHKGLTYSDFIFQKKIKFERKLAIVSEVLAFLNQEHIKNLFIRSIPFIFQSVTDESCAYIYHKTEAKIEQIKPFLVIDQRNGIVPNHNRKKNYKKLLKNDYQLDNKISDLPVFWQIVEKNLKDRYNTTPVHSLDEIKILSKRFPNQIKLFSIKKDGQVLAGALVFFINQAAHFQYIHALDTSESRQAVEFLTYELVQQFKKNTYISFGTSAVLHNNLNKNLVYWKESFGCQLVNQLFFKVNTQHFDRLKNVLK